MKVVQLKVITIISMAAIVGCNPGNKPAQIKKAGTDSVAAFLLKKSPVSKQVSFPAELLPKERAEISAKVSGYIKSLKVDIGDPVKQGQVLAVLEAPEYFSNWTSPPFVIETVCLRCR